MKPLKHPGTCLLCRGTVGKKGAQRHLEDCLPSTGWPEGPHPSYIIRIDGRHAPSFWMFVLVRHDAMFSDLDSLFADVWMGEEDEMSSFTIQGTMYIDAETKKCVPLADRIEEGQIFYYTYAAHSTEEVELRCKVVGMTSVMPPGGLCCLVARNIPALPSCCMCGDKAEFLAVDPDAFDPFDENDGGNYYCRDCLMDLDSVIISPFANSPRIGACFNMDDLETVLDWYPPGWDMGNFISEDMQEILGMAMEMPDEYVSLSDSFLDDDDIGGMVHAVNDDIGKEIDGFLDKEEARGEDRYLSEEIVMALSTLQYGLYERKIREWDAPLVRTSLLEDVVENPYCTDEWVANFVPVCCRFLTYMETAGIVEDAADMIAALEEAEPDFLEEISDHQDLLQSFDDLEDTEFEDLVISMKEDVSELLISAMKDLIAKAQTDNDSPEFRAIMDDIMSENPGLQSMATIQNGIISDKCEGFCTRMDDESVAEHCREIMSVLADHPDEPLSRGNDFLWSGAIVYVACQEEGRIGRQVKGSALLAQDICEHFDLKLSSVQSKASGLKKYLVDKPKND